MINDGAECWDRWIILFQRAFIVKVTKSDTKLKKKSLFHYSDTSVSFRYIPKYCNAEIGGYKMKDDWRLVITQVTLQDFSQLKMTMKFIEQQPTKFNILIKH